MKLSLALRLILIFVFSYVEISSSQNASRGIQENEATGIDTHSTLVNSNTTISCKVTIILKSLSSIYNFETISCKNFRRIQMSLATSEIKMHCKKMRSLKSSVHTTELATLFKRKVVPLFNLSRYNLTMIKA